MLHELPDDKKVQIKFCKVHGLNDKKYLVKHLGGKQDETYGWQLLEKVRWLQHESSGTIVLVVGHSKTFFPLPCSTGRPPMRIHHRAEGGNRAVQLQSF